MSSWPASRSVLHESRNPPKDRSAVHGRHRLPRGVARAPAGSRPQGTSHRLGVAALVYATVYLLAYGSSRVSTLHVLPGEMTWSHDVVAAEFIVFSLGVYFAVRGTRIPAFLLLDLGLIYEVIAAAGIEIPILFWRAGVADVTQVNGISWVCVWMVFFTLIVPSTPGKTFLAAMGAASMRPFAYLLLAAQGSELPAAPTTSLSG